MKYSISSILLAIAFLLPTQVFAQAIQVNLDKKVILTDSLNMPSNTSAYSLLTLLPEMLQRPGDSYLSNYVVKIEGLSVNQAADVALNQIMIGDIEKIEVDESPISSYNNNGVGGSINLVLRSHGQHTDRLWGSAGIAVSYPTDIAPQFVIGHRSDKFMIRGILLSDIYNNNSSVESTTYDNTGKFESTAKNEINYRYRSQLANAYMLYKPTARDEIKLKVSESYSYTKEHTTPGHIAEQTSKLKATSTTFNALLNYKHSFPRASFVAETQYQYNPSTTDKLVPDMQTYANTSHSHSISGKVELKSALLPSKSRSSMDLGVGCNLNGVFKNDKTNSHLLSYNHDINSEPRNNTFFVQPYVFVELTAGKLRLKTTGEIQHFRYDIKRFTNDYSVISNDVTAQLIAEWHFTPTKNIRLIVDRKLQRPSDGQLYPMLNYNLESMVYVKGNPYLTPIMSHEVRLDYITDYKWNSHALTFDASISYNNVHDIIKGVEEGSSPAPGMMGQSLIYNTYVNGGTNHIYNANLMTLYRYKSFMLTFTGNLYHKTMPNEGSHSHYTYYNIAIHPQFSLKDGWHGGAKFTYFSKVRLAGGTLSNCSTASMSIGKQWKGLFVYAFNTVALHKNAEDTSRTADGHKTIKAYEMVPNTVGLGAKYTF